MFLLFLQLMPCWASESLCFGDVLSAEHCCSPRPVGQEECWDDNLNFERCCGSSVLHVAGQINKENYVARCSEGTIDDACDAAALRLAKDLTEQLDFIDRKNCTETTKKKMVDELCPEPELCRLLLLRWWDIETRKGLKEVDPGPKKAAWCASRAARLRTLDPDRFIREARFESENSWSLWIRRCREMQLVRIHQSQAFGKIPLTNQSGEDFMQEQPRVMVLVALAGPGLERFKDYVAWWRCYAEKHGYRFLLDHEVREGDLVTSWDLSGLFRSDRKTFLSQISPYLWFKLLSAKRHLDETDWLILVDHDMVPTPGCGMEVPIVEVFGKSCCKGTCWCHVVTADQWPMNASAFEGRGLRFGGEEKNSGFTMIRNSGWGNLFLDLALERRQWPGLGMADQDAMAEAMLELIGLENAQTEAGPSRPLYHLSCLSEMFLKPKSLYSLEHRPYQYSSSSYGICWRLMSARLSGRSGRRKSKLVGIINPRVANLNANPYMRRFWQVPKGGWKVERAGFGLGTANSSDKFSDGGDRLLVLHFAGLGPSKESLMSWGLRAHYGIRVNASCSALNAVARTPRIRAQPACRSLELKRESCGPLESGASDRQ